MITLENQLGNLQVSNGPNIMDEITQLVSLGRKATEEALVHHLMSKFPEYFKAFCDTISPRPSSPSLFTFVGMLRYRTMTQN